MSYLRLESLLEARRDLVSVEELDLKALLRERVEGGKDEVERALELYRMEVTFKLSFIFIYLILMMILTETNPYILNVFRRIGKP